MTQSSQQADLSSAQRKIYQPLPNEPLCLNLGCGRSIMSGFVNCDKSPSKNTDLVFDLEEKWPFKNNSVSEIYCSHTLEHLKDHMAFFEEAWRVMKPKAQMTIRVPYGSSRAAMADMTHIRPWYIESFASLQPGYNEGTLGNHYDAHKAFFWMVDGTITIPAFFYYIYKIPFIGKKIVELCVNHLIGVGRELWSVLEKTHGEDHIPGRHPMQTPYVFSIWIHELKGKKMKPGETSGFVRLDR